MDAFLTLITATIVLGEYAPALENEIKNRLRRRENIIVRCGMSDVLVMPFDDIFKVSVIRIIENDNITEFVELPYLRKEWYPTHIGNVLKRLRFICSADFNRQVYIINGEIAQLMMNCVPQQMVMIDGIQFQREYIDDKMRRGFYHPREYDADYRDDYRDDISYDSYDSYGRYDDDDYGIDYRGNDYGGGDGGGGAGGGGGGHYR